MERNLKSYLKIALALFVLVELGVIGYWLFYQSEAARGVVSTAIIPPGVPQSQWIWIEIEVILSALNWLGIINTIAILFGIVFVGNAKNLPTFVLLLISLFGSIGLAVRGILLFNRLSWLFVIGIIVAVAVAMIAILVYAKESKAS